MSTRAPLIGITPDIQSGGKHAVSGEPAIFLLERYNRAVLEAGGIPLILPILTSRGPIQRLLDRCNGILLTGGDFDIHPRHYGEEPQEGLRDIKEERTEFELEVISLALDRDLPLMGVCGGEQAINVALGGTLYQDIALQVPDALEHLQSTVEKEAGHRIQVHNGTLLSKILECRSLEVNTTHHQAVKQVGRKLIVNAVSEDGVIEGIESTNHSFVLGVQWHPELLMDGNARQQQIYLSLIAAAQGEKHPR
ncbi:MAG: gamma-glutamyl-gamma-aminobutyrate hydrolase family protein [Candidatus Binatia bacterium]|jgi:putative glutamine amidotransferase|nr:gamma-glutamyl-gamma-aminobutyrate hydrolase family protein [Candidatus Binatia bacterium]